MTMPESLRPGSSDAPGSARVRRDCPQCDSSAHRALPAYSRGGWEIVACSACEFVYLKEAPTYDQLVASDFAWEKSFANEKARRRAEYPLLTWLDETTRWRLTVFTPDEKRQLARMFPPGRVLDVGCGGGDRLPDSVTPYGVEISDALWKQANAVMKARGGACMHGPAVEGTASYPDNYFSGVLLRSFLEHEMHPKPLLKACYAKLQPGGVVYIRVPNYSGWNRRLLGVKWPGFRFPDHVNYFTDRSLKVMAQSCGFCFTLLGRWKFYTDDNIHALLTKLA